MRRSLAGSVLAFLAACASGGSSAASIDATATAPAPDVFECVRKELKAIGWTQTSYDTEELRVTAQKYDTEARRPDVQFRRLIHRLTIEIDPETNGTGATLEITPATYQDLATQRGPTEVKEAPGKDAIAAAQTLAERCGK